MRNKYAQKCYKCAEMVEVGEGHFERKNGSWRAKHRICVAKNVENILGYFGVEAQGLNQTKQGDEK